MTSRDPLDGFADDLLAAVAADHGVDEAGLRDAVSTHQTGMRDLPGVEDLVYEWRTRYRDPLLARRPEAYYLMLPPDVWEEFDTVLEYDDPVLQALRAVHTRRTHRDLDERSTSPLGDHAQAIVIVRE